MIQFFFLPHNQSFNKLAQQMAEPGIQQNIRSEEFFVVAYVNVNSVFRRINKSVSIVFANVSTPLLLNDLQQDN